MSDFKIVMSTINRIQSTTLSVELKIKEMQETYNVLEEHRIQVSNLHFTNAESLLLLWRLKTKRRWENIFNEKCHPRCFHFCYFFSFLFIWKSTIKEEVLENDFAIHPFIRSYISYVVSLRRHVDGISFREAMEKVVQLCIVPYENLIFDKSQILSNDIQWYWKV